MEKFKKPEVKKGMIEILPKKDHVIKQNEVFIEIKKGKKIDVPSIYKETLKTEGVI